MNSNVIFTNLLRVLMYIFSLSIDWLILYNLFHKKILRILSSFLASTKLADSNTLSLNNFPSNWNTCYLMSNSQTICNLAWAHSSLYVYIVAIKDMVTPPLNNKKNCMTFNNLLDGKWSIATHNVGTFEKNYIRSQKWKICNTSNVFQQIHCSILQKLTCTIDMEKQLYMSKVVNDLHG